MGARMSRRRTFAKRRAPAAAVAGVLALLVPLTAPQATLASTVPATSDTSPVNLSTAVDMAAGKAAQRATVVTGDARFEVLTPEVVRLEYSPAGTFLDQPTLNVLDRDFPVPTYTESSHGGWLYLATTDLVLRYHLGSGPFDPTNTQVQLLHPLPGTASTVRPSWEWECTFGQVCQSGAATLAGGAALSTGQANYQSPAGFITGYLTAGADATWQLLGAQPGDATVIVRYSNGTGGGRTMSLVVNGTTTQVTLPPTPSWDDWATLSKPVALQAGPNTVAVSCGNDDSCNVDIDDIAVAAPGATPAPFLPADQLGGYIRSFDSAGGTYTYSPSCTNGEPSDTCTASIPPEQAGLLDRSGWYLLDDTHSAVWAPDGWVAPRPSGDVEDGYLFGYGQDYTVALTDLTKLTGPVPLLPEYTFGNWYSEAGAHSSADYEDEVLPEFRANGVSLDTLSVDSAWKSPNTWDGWEWDPTLFPDPSAFLAWAASQGIHVTLNIHPSISTDDPEYGEAQAIAGNTLLTGDYCYPARVSTCAVWDWGSVAQAESYFALQQPVQDQGVSFWWLDYCCDTSYVSMPGVTPDSWANHLYAQQLADSGQRGFVLARIGGGDTQPGAWSSLQESNPGAYATGAWADHRSAIAFTADSWGTWNTLATEARLAQDEGSIGEPYASDDIGSTLGPPPNEPADPSDLYLRWLQLGTFQPVMREHSLYSSGGLLVGGLRLPWQYGGTTQAIGDQFMQLREELVPYLYTLAAQASSTGMPMAQALYLDYPDQANAYNYPGEYLLGPEVLVAPVTTPGQVATTQVWFPPGRWADWFTGATFYGPSTQTLTVPMDRMPVFVKAGGIVPLQPSSGQAATAGSAALTLRVFAGQNGSYTLYDDAGQGLGYQQGEYTETPITYMESAGKGYTSTVVIGAAQGSYPGAPTTRPYQVDLVGISKPSAVVVDGRALPSWAYDATTHTLAVTLSAVPADRPTTLTQVGGSAFQAAEPAATQLSIDPSTSLVLGPGQTTTVSTTLANGGPGPVTGVSLGLEAPSGWELTSTAATTAASLGAGSSLSSTWSLSAPSTPAGQSQAATLTATASYTDTATDVPTTVTAEQVATPTITSVSPTTVSPGQVVTVSGVNFGAVQGSGYITFSDQGTAWGAPGCAATFSLDSWSDSQVTFTVPSPSGPNNEWQVVPGSQATITVMNADYQTSNTATVTIASG